MKGTKVVLILIALIIATNVRNLEAERIQYMQKPPNATDVTWPPELEGLRACLSKCKPNDNNCVMECTKRELKQKDPTLIKTLFQGSLEIMDSVFCTLGCTVSEVCGEVNNIGKF